MNARAGVAARGEMVPSKSTMMPSLVQ
jgi:hypothetical protein